jgi:hypothetical protein
MQGAKLTAASQRSPLAAAISEFGVRGTARLLGVAPSTVSRVRRGQWKLTKRLYRRLELAGL